MRHAINTNTRYIIMENNGLETHIYHGMQNLGKGQPKHPIFLNNPVNWGIYYPHTYKDKSWAVRMLNRCRERMERRSAFGLRRFFLVELTYDERGNIVNQNELHF